MSASSGHRGVVLLTGIRGFTGRYVADALVADGYAVVGTALADAGEGERDLDLTSADACAALVDEIRPDFVVHLAAISFVAHEDPTDFYRVNVVGTTHLLAALAAHAPGVRKVVLASSANVYGNVGGAPLVEAQPFAPTNHYAASKVAMEQMAANWFERLPVVVTRPFNYTGPGQSPSFLVPKIVSHFARGERTIELGNIEVERDFSDVRTVAEVYRRLLAADVRSRCLNVCSGVAVSLRRVIALTEAIAGYPIEVRVNPAFVRANDIQRLTGDPSALTRAIGPIAPVPFRQTLEDMYRAMR